ncbi:MAG TPA: chemotaxis protein CheW [Gemmatimonadaceae bacterium]|nr:chemotaxis protein CheW [Gemmatimonadaceae bacterium]
MTAAVASAHDPDRRSRERLRFRIGAEFFAMDLAAVEEVIEAPEVHALPEMPDALLGVFRLRERLLRVYSPAACLNVSPASEAAVVLVIRVSDDTRIGLAIDDVEDVMMLNPGAIRPVPVADGDGVLRGVVHCDAELVSLVDAPALVSACLGSRHPEGA